MSILSVTTINTKDSITDLIATTGNNSAGKFVLSANGGFVVYSNSSTVSMNVVSNGEINYSGNSVNYSGGAYYLGKVGYGNSAPLTNLQLDGNYGISTTTITSSNNININCASGNYFIATCDGSAANIYFTNTPTNTAFAFVLVLANGGTNTISWANTPKWPSASAPSSSTNTDIWTFFTENGGTTWRGTQVQKDSR